MKCLMVLLALLQSAAPFQDQGTQNTTVAIEGFVVRAGTNEPISRARITIIKMTGPGGAPIPPGPRPTIPAVTTDSQGHFVFKDLDPGSYSVTAQRNGFARQVYGERAPGRPGAPLNLVAGQILQDVVFHLIPGGTITGRVADVTGEPIAGMTVQLVKSSYDLNGKRNFQTVDSARTDDRGEYRIYWITPGRYYLNVSPRPIGPIMFPNTNAVIEPGYVLTYYPGTVDSSRAEIIEVQPGAELSAIDFSLEQKVLFRVRGRIFDTRTGQLPRNASVSISPRTPTGGFTFGTYPVNYNAANGTFEIRDVPPGSYWVRAIAVDPRIDSTSTGMARNSVQLSVDVTSADIENVSLALTPGFQLKGRVILDGGSLATLSDIERTTVFLEPIDPLPFGSPQQQLKADGLFTLEAPSGDYHVLLFATPANTFIESIRLGQTDVSSGMSISGPISDSLEIVLSTKGGLIEGAILDKEQKPMPGVQAVLIPDRQRDRRDAYRVSTADQNGQFTMRRIAPGDYKLFAWEDLEPGAYYDPEFIRKYEDLATPVTVSESAALNIVVKALPAN